MKIVAREDVWKTVLAAVVGSMVALLVSPFVQSLSFLVNEYLARPILSIEYAEIVPEEEPVSYPAKEVQALLTSQGFQSGLMRIGAEPGLMAFHGGKEVATTAELQALKAATKRLLTAIEKRAADLGTFRKVLVPGSNEGQVREVAARYQGLVATMAPVGDVKSLSASLLAAINAESAALAETIDLGKSLLKSLGPAADGSPRKIKLKLSVLNRGSTDGLIRNVGELNAPSSNLTVKLRRSSPPAEPGAEALFAMAVPVAVTNPAPDTRRATSVGKVEKHSMNEFWMEVDETATPEDTVITFAALATEGELGEVTVVLFDHQSKKIERKILTPAK